MKLVIWLAITLSCAALFTGIGIYAWRKEKPMGFYSGIAVRESEISDVPAYNRANGRMWIGFSCVFWISALLGIANVGAAGIVLTVGCLVGCVCLLLVFNNIYNRYKAR